jgi:hypothetical protein
MNSKIVIPISIIVTIVIVVFSLTQIEITEKQTTSQIKETSEINAVLEKIKQDTIKNNASENPYKPKPREWIQSGPFQIDRSQYVIGEKVFVKINHLNENIEGSMLFYKELNSTHSFVYYEMPFDGSKPQTNFYLDIGLSKSKGICTTEELIGDWKLVFVDNNIGAITNLDFKIINQILPGLEERFEPVC